MKVERGTVEKFEPVIITLGSEEEAELLWHFLNCTNDTLKLILEKEYNESLEELHEAMWEEFSDVYNPNGHRDC